MVAKTNVESELLSVYDIPKRKRSEDVQVYYERVIRAVTEGEGPEADAKWEKLSQTAQEWANVAGKALEAQKDIADFPGAEETADAGEATPKAKGKVTGKAATGKTTGKTKATPEATSDAKGSTRPKAATTKAGKGNGAAAKAPAAKPRGAKKEGVYASTQRYVVGHPAAKTDEIMDALKKKGLEPSQHTVQSVRGHTRDTLRLVQEIHGTDLGFE